MKKNVFIKIIFILIIALNVINIQGMSFATGTTSEGQTSSVSIDGFMSSAKEFVDGGKAEGENVIKKQGLQKISNLIYNTLFAIGMIVAVAVGIFLGIKLMMGSIEEKAEYKQLLTPYFIGCIVVFGAFGIWKIIVNLMQNSLG